MSTTTSTLCPESLRETPQVAALDVLVHAADTAVVALIAAHPDLERSFDEQPPPLEQLADQVIEHAMLAVLAVDRYRALLRDIAHQEASFDCDTEF